LLKLSKFWECAMVYRDIEGSKRFVGTKASKERGDGWEDFDRQLKVNMGSQIIPDSKSS